MLALLLSQSSVIQGQVRALQRCRLNSGAGGRHQLHTLYGHLLSHLMCRHRRSRARAAVCPSRFVLLLGLLHQYSLHLCMQYIRDETSTGCLDRAPASRLQRPLHAPSHRYHHTRKLGQAGFLFPHALQEHLQWPYPVIIWAATRRLDRMNTRRAMSRRAWTRSSWRLT